MARRQRQMCIRDRSHAANFAKLRKVLCLDARSMEDASAKEIRDSVNDLFFNTKNAQNVA